MTSKWIKRGIIGLVLFVVVGGVLFGKDLSSYVRSTAKMTQDKVKDAVPIEFELCRAQDLLEEILPEKIRMRFDKGGNTIPNVFARALKDEEIFREIIEEGRLKNQYHYVDYGKLNEMLDSYKKEGKLKRRNYGIREFQSSMSVLILQKWQREGKIDIGIKC